MHKANIIKSGKSAATKALIMLHGRGSSANDILSLANHLNVGEFALYAPQATNNSWYPQSFLAKPEANEPWLSSALDVVQQTLNQAVSDGISTENIYFTGFSQGACLVSEFIARHAAKYGGIAIFTGGLIGDQIYENNYNGEFGNTPVFIGSSNPDFHVPVERVSATTSILKKLGAHVTEKIYENIGHTIIPDEIELANELIFK